MIVKQGLADLESLAFLFFMASLNMCSFPPFEYICNYKEGCKQNNFCKAQQSLSCSLAEPSSIIKFISPATYQDLEDSQ